MKVILRLDNDGKDCNVYTSKRNLQEVMRELWENQYNECLADLTEDEPSQEDSWVETDENGNGQAQIVCNGHFVSEFMIIEVKEI